MLCSVCTEQAFVCLGSWTSSLTSHPAPPLTQPPAGIFLGTPLRPEEMFSLDAWQCLIIPRPEMQSFSLPEADRLGVCNFLLVGRKRRHRDGLESPSISRVDARPLEPSCVYMLDPEVP